MFRTYKHVEHLIARLAVAGWIAAALAGCAGSARPGAEETSAGKDQPVAEVTGRQAKGRAQIWSENCMSCHNMRSPETYSDAQWEVAMHHMRLRANLTAEEHRAILEFLKSSN